MVLGSGPIRIGQGIEFDYCSVHCVWAVSYTHLAFTISPVILMVALFALDLVLYYPFVKLQIKQNSETAENVGVTVE